MSGRKLFDPTTYMIPEDDAEAPKHVGVFVIYFNIVIYIKVYLLVQEINNKQYKFKVWA